MARQINKHLSRYTPVDRFATAVFIVLNRDSGELTYVNAGHNAPIVFSSGSTTLLEATGMPLGLFSEAEYEARTAVIRSGWRPPRFHGWTDRLDSRRESRKPICAMLWRTVQGQTMSILKSLVDPKFNEDDVTILLLKRPAASASSTGSA